MHCEDRSRIPDPVQDLGIIAFLVPTERKWTSPRKLGESFSLVRRDFFLQYRLKLGILIIDERIKPPPRHRAMILREGTQRRAYKSGIRSFCTSDLPLRIFRSRHNNAARTVAEGELERNGDARRERKIHVPV